MNIYLAQHELDTVQHVKEEIEELRDYVEKIEKDSHRRKLRLLEQVKFASPVRSIYYELF